MVSAKYPIGRVIITAGAPLELYTAPNTIFRHVLRGRFEEVWTRLVMGLLDDVTGPSSRVHPVQVCMQLYYNKKNVNVYLTSSRFNRHVTVLMFLIQRTRKYTAQVRIPGRIRGLLDCARRRVPHRFAVWIRTVFPELSPVHHNCVARFSRSQLHHVYYR